MKFIYILAFLAMPMAAKAGPLSDMIEMAYGIPASKLLPADALKAGAVTLGGVTCQNSAGAGQQPMESSAGNISGNFQSAAASADAAVLCGLDSAAANAITLVAIGTSNSQIIQMDDPDRSYALLAEKAAGCQILNTNAKMVLSTATADIQLLLSLRAGTQPQTLVNQIQKSLGSGFTVLAGKISSGPTSGADSILVQSQSPAMIGESLIQLDQDHLSLLK